MALDGDDLRRLPLSLRKTNLARLLVRRPAPLRSPSGRLSLSTVPYFDTSVAQNPRSRAIVRPRA
jgi:hypothetical protein